MATHVILRPPMFAGGIQFAPSPGGYETKAYYPFDFKPRHSQQRPAGAP